MILSLNCFYSIFAKKHKSQDHFIYIKNLKFIPRNCCFGVITLCSPQKCLFLLNSNKSSSVIPKSGFGHTLVVQYTLSMFYLQCSMRVHSNNHCTGFLLSFWSSVVFSHGFSILQYANRVLNLLSTHLLQLVDCFFKPLVINIT